MFSSKILVSALLGLAALVTLALAITNLLDKEYEPSDVPERLLVDIEDPDYRCREKARLTQALTEAIENSRACSDDEDCVLLQGCRSDAIATSHLSEIRLTLQRLREFDSGVMCGPIAKPSMCLRAGSNPAAICEQGLCTNQDIGLPPGV